MLFKYENKKNGRWFYIEVEKDLFCPYTLTVRHGGTQHQRSVTVRHYGYPHQCAMLLALGNLMKRREKHGYTLVVD